jgi:hypothetical protein
MSISLMVNCNQVALQEIHAAFERHIVAEDVDLVLLEEAAAPFDARVLGGIANAAQQPVTLKMHRIGEVVTLHDGSEYRVTARGWRKV